MSANRIVMTWPTPVESRKKVTFRTLREDDPPLLDGGT
jgi:hypothetical protein